jgi:hypothetical protein
MSPIDSVEQIPLLKKCERVLIAACRRDSSTYEYLLANAEM